MNNMIYLLLAILLNPSLESQNIYCLTSKILFGVFIFWLGMIKTFTPPFY